MPFERAIDRAEMTLQPMPNSEERSIPTAEYITSGQTSGGLTASVGSNIYVNSGGTTRGTTVLSGGLEQIQGGTASGTTVSAGGSQTLLVGTTVGTTVISGGLQIVSGGTAQGTLVGSRAGAVVDLGGVASGMTVVNGGSAYIEGGRAFATVINGGTMTVGAFYAGPFALDEYYGSSVSTTVGSGGTQILLGNTTDENSTVLSGGMEVVSVQAPVTSLTLQAGATLDLRQFPYLSYLSAVIGPSGNDFVFSGATNPIEVKNVKLAGSYTGDKFVTVADPAGDTEIIVTAPCYARGTRLLTARGEVPVEALRAEDRMVTEAGDQASIRWIGVRRVDCRRHPRPELVWPVRIAAGAFADGVPRRDLLVSPDHAVFADGVLIPVQHLINGQSIVQVTVAGVEYWHVELARHDILLAEGLPTESYLDTGNRAQFDNAGTVIGFHPDFSAPRSWNDACARLVESGPLVVALKRRLFVRACVETAPRLGLHVTADDRPCAARRLDGGLWRLKIPAGARDLRLQSPPWMPAACIADSLDRRQLGVRLFAVETGGGTIPLDDPALRGFHPVEITAEGRCRWTNGNGLIVLPAGASSATLRIGDESSVLPGSCPLVARRTERRIM